MTTIVRFAPSPTGRIHIGNIRTALINWLFAAKQGGQFMLRLDDTDQARSKQEYADGIREDLEWLGLKWDFEDNQSSRFERYDAVTEQLKAEGKLYACYETSDELDRKRRRQLARKMPPVYDRAGLSLTDEEKLAFEAEGRKPHWRFKLEQQEVIWSDLVRGQQRVDAASLSDPVLIREDNSYLYTLPSVIDDIDFKISHVIRGEDHVANTGAQIQIFEALGAAPPEFGHHNLLVGGDGQALSKRLGALSIESLRNEGLEPLAVVSHAATIGTSDPVAPFLSMQALADNFEFGKLSRAPARFDQEELKALNAKLLQLYSYQDVETRLVALGVEGGEALWDAVKGNIKTLEQAKFWSDIVYSDISPVIKDAELCAAAAKLLPEGVLDEDSWKTWTDAVKQETGAKGKNLFMPLRLALTGEENGPELKFMLPLMGAERVKTRLSGQKG